MKLGDSNLVTISVTAAVVLSLVVPTKPQTSTEKHKDHEFPISVGMYMEQYTILPFLTLCKPDSLCLQNETGLKLILDSENVKFLLLF